MSCDLVGRRQAASVALSEYLLRFAYLFGSHAEGRPRVDSDLDVAVVLIDGIVGPESERVASRCADALSAAALWSTPCVPTRSRSSIAWHERCADAIRRAHVLASRA